MLGIEYCTLRDYVTRRDYIPLTVLKKMEDMSGVCLLREHNKLRTKKNMVEMRLPIRIDKNLAQIIGAIIADGHLKIRKAQRGKQYECVLREEYESNVVAFCTWMSEAFGIYIVPVKEKQWYATYISNKVLVLYLHRILEIPLGNKSSIVAVPSFLQKAEKQLKNAFLQGIFMFDGGVDYCTGYVSLTTKSKLLVEGVNKILCELQLEPDYVSNKPDRFGRYKILFRKKEKLVKCMQLFQIHTEKWYRLKEHFYGFENQTNDKAVLYEALQRYYPRKRESALTFTDILVVLETKNELTCEQVSKELKRGKTTIYAYLEKLTRWEILQSKIKEGKNYWYLGEEFNFPKREPDEMFKYI